MIIPTQKMTEHLTYSKSKLQTVCRACKIKELIIFGSALREDFRPDSDVDITVTFTNDAQWGLRDFYALREESCVLSNNSFDRYETYCNKTIIPA